MTSSFFCTLVHSHDLGKQSQFQTPESASVSQFRLLGGFNNKHFSQFFRLESSRKKNAGRFDVWYKFSFWPVDSCLIVVFKLQRSEWKASSLVSLFIKVLIPSWGLHLYDLPKAPLPNIIIWIRVKTYEFGGDKKTVHKNQGMLKLPISITSYWFRYEYVRQFRPMWYQEQSGKKFSGKSILQLKKKLSFILSLSFLMWICALELL